jgi:hypothetical protein
MAKAKTAERAVRHALRATQEGEMATLKIVTKEQSRAVFVAG